MQAIIICMVLRNTTTIHGIGYLPLQFSQTPNLALFYGWRVSGAYTGPPAGCIFSYGRLCPCLHRISPPGRLPLASLFSLVLPPDQNSPPPPRSRAPAPASLAAARIPRRCWTAIIADEEEPYMAVRIPWRGWRRPDGDVCIFLASLLH